MRNGSRDERPRRVGVDEEDEIDDGVARGVMSCELGPGVLGGRVVARGGVNLGGDMARTEGGVVRMTGVNRDESLLSSSDSESWFDSESLSSRGDDSSG